MAIYRIEITETLQRVVEVEADSPTQAELKAESKYLDGDFVLDYNDCKGFSIEVKED